MLAKDIVDNYEMKLVEDKKVWQTNTGTFNKKYKAVARNMLLPNFLTKQEIPTSLLSINPNPNEKYRAIFGLDFLVAKGIDCLNSKEKIMWEGIGVPMRMIRAHIGDWPALDKSKIKDNKY